MSTRGITITLITTTILATLAVLAQGLYESPCVVGNMQTDFIFSLLTAQTGLTFSYIQKAETDKKLSKQQNLKLYE